MSDTHDHEVMDDAVLSLIISHAKPTTTLVHLRTLCKTIMDENDLKMSLGRLWRSVAILRSAAPNGQVLYWTEKTARAVSASGVRPDMPMGKDIPEYALTVFNAKEQRNSVVPIEQRIEANNTPIASFASDEIPEVSLPLVRPHLGMLVPISETASLPMRPSIEGMRGSLRRNSITGKVATAFFKYRDVRLSIDGATSLCPGVSRADVSRVISQLSTTLVGKNYFIRHRGATRIDSMYQWNPIFSYPFAERQIEDGMDVPLRNVEEIEDTQRLDHLPPNQLTEEEVNSELAKLLQANVIEDAANEDEEVEQEDAEQENEEQDEIEQESEQDDVTITSTPYPSSSYFPASNSITVNSEQAVKEEQSIIPLIEAPFFALEKTSTLHSISPRGNTSISEQFKAPQQLMTRSTDVAFKAGIFTDGSMTLFFDDEVKQLSPQQAGILIDLLGPQYLARKAA